jgi:hypothetical protein
MAFVELPPQLRCSPLFGERGAVFLRDRNDLTSFYRFVDKNYKRFIDFAQNLIDYTVYHEEEIEHRERFAGFGEIAETTTEGGNGVHQRNSEIERYRTATTGGLTEEEIASPLTFHIFHPCSLDINQKNLTAAHINNRGINAVDTPVIYQG